MASVRACCSPLLYLLVSLTGPDLFGRVLVYVSAAQIRHMRSVGNVQILLDQDERFERRRWRSFRRRCHGHNGFVESISKLTIGNLQIYREPLLSVWGRLHSHSTGTSLNSTDPAPGAEDKLRQYVDAAWPALGETIRSPGTRRHIL